MWGGLGCASSLLPGPVLRPYAAGMCLPVFAPSLQRCCVRAAEPPSPFPLPCRARMGVQKVLRREFAALLRTHVELAVQVSCSLFATWDWVLQPVSHEVLSCAQLGV